MLDAVDTWLLTAWPRQTHLFRVLPGETASVAALEGLPPRRVPVRPPGEGRPYLWYEPVPEPVPQGDV